MFQTVQLEDHQSGRILRASWGLFCVAIFAAYAALLTSHATAPQEHPKINNLEDLLEHHDFKIGTSLDISYFITSLRMAKAGTTHARLWQVLCDQNESDPRTFSTDKSYHIRRVLDGKYAFLGNIPERMLPTYVKADFSNVKLAKLHYRTFCVTVPQKTFYKYDIERALQTAIEMGIIQSIMDKWIPDQSNLECSEFEEKTQVHLIHLQVLMYYVATGVCVATLSLIIEYCSQL